MENDVIYDTDCVSLQPPENPSDGHKTENNLKDDDRTSPGPCQTGRHDETQRLSGAYEAKTEEKTAALAGTEIEAQNSKESPRAELPPLSKVQLLITTKIVFLCDPLT